MRLSDREREILSCVQLSAHEGSGKVKKLTGYREHTIRHVLQRARAHGILRRRCFVNLFKLGYSQYEVFFSLAADTRLTRPQLLEALLTSERVSWVGELGGDYQYGLNICVRNVCEVSRFLSDLSLKHGFRFLEKAISARLALHYFGNKYLSSRKSAEECFCYSASSPLVNIDDTDHRILNALMQIEYGSWRELSRKLGMPFSTLEHRLRKLEELGVIVGYYFHLEPSLLNMQGFLILVSAKGFSEDLSAQIFHFAREHRNITVMVETIGNWDFELAAEVEDARAVLDITNSLHDRFGNEIQSIRVLPSFGYPKIVEYPFSLARAV